MGNEHFQNTQCYTHCYNNVVSIKYIILSGGVNVYTPLHISLLISISFDQIGTYNIPVVGRRKYKHFFLCIISIRIIFV